jgi:hypothetical protein
MLHGIVTGTEASLVSVNLAYARSQIAEVLGSIDNLLANAQRQHPDR